MQALFGLAMGILIVLIGMSVMTLLGRRLGLRRDKLARDQSIILAILMVFCVALAAFLVYVGPPKGTSLWLLFGLLLGGAVWAWFRKDLELPTEKSEVFDQIDNKA